MHPYFRFFLIGICLLQFGAAAGFIMQHDAVVDLWPLAYTNEMSFYFIASIFAAAGTSTLWCVLAREDGALAGIALDYVTILLPVAILAFQLDANRRGDELRNFGIVCMAGVIFGAGLLLWSVRIPIRDRRPMPRPVRWAFVVFIIALLIVGSQLILKRGGILPWSITDSGSVIYGWMFIGAAAYFAYALLRPSWHNAAGQLIGFLAYDLVLIIPFLRALPDIRDQWRLSLIVYIGVVVISGALAIYYLFIHPETRIFGSREMIPQPEPA